MKLDRKGFTLIELLATVIILAIVLSVGSYSIINIMKSAKEKDYALLIDNIKAASELLYQECRYSQDVLPDSQICNVSNGEYKTTLGKLVNYGYLKANAKDSNNKNTKILDPKNNNDISSCEIVISYVDDLIVVKASGSNSNCPTEY